MSEVVSGLSDGQATAKAVDEVKEGLYMVKVSRADARTSQKEVEGQGMKYWREGCEIMKTDAIQVDNIDPFLDYMRDSYEGITGAIRKKLNGIKFSDNSWSYKVIEVELKPEDESSIRYGMIGFGKSPDKTTVACMYVMFWAKFEFANDIEYHQDTRSILWGLGKWTKTTKTEKAKVINEGMIRQLKNFFRFKALEGFMKEGIIDRINYVPTIDDIDDINK